VGSHASKPTSRFSASTGGGGGRNTIVDVGTRIEIRTNLKAFSRYRRVVFGGGGRPGLTAMWFAGATRSQPRFKYAGEYRGVPSYTRIVIWVCACPNYDGCAPHIAQSSFWACNSFFRPDCNAACVSTQTRGGYCAASRCSSYLDLNWVPLFDNKTSEFPYNYRFSDRGREGGGAAQGAHLFPLREAILDIQKPRVAFLRARQRSH